MKIIVVDDEPLIADTLVNVLQGEGHHAFGFSDGRSAIKWAEMIVPDAVVTDVIMPVINGIETAKAILKLFPDCRIILFSGQAASSDLLAQATEEGHRFEILAKPINPRILLERLRNGPDNATEAVAI